MEKVPMIFDFDCAPSVYGTAFNCWFWNGTPKEFGYSNFPIIGLFTRIYSKTQSPQRSYSR